MSTTRHQMMVVSVVRSFSNKMQFFHKWCLSVCLSQWGQSISEKDPHSTYSLIQKNGDTFAIVYSSKCVTIFLNQTLIPNNRTLSIILQNQTKPLAVSQKKIDYFFFFLSSKAKWALQWKSALVRSPDASWVKSWSYWFSFKLHAYYRKYLSWCKVLKKIHCYISTFNPRLEAR